VAKYNCRKCPGYCCSYPLIILTKKDVARLAKGFGMEFEKADKKFTRPAEGYKRTMRRVPDEHYGKICQFFDQEKRCCGIYEIRPAICRDFPGEDSKCGYYEFLKFERSGQEDKEYVSVTNHTEDA